MKKVLFAALMALFCVPAFAENVDVSTYHVSPYGSYRGLTVTESSTDALTLKEGYIQFQLATWTGTARSSQTEQAIDIDASGGTRFITNYSVRMSIANSGGAQVSVGSGAFDARVQVGVASSDGFVIQPGSLRVRSDHSNGVPYIDWSNDAVSDYDARISYPQNYSLAIDGANLGVGDTVPSAKLHVTTPGVDPPLGVPFGQLSGTKTNNGLAVIGNDVFVDPQGVFRYAMDNIYAVGSRSAGVALNYPQTGKISVISSPAGIHTRLGAMAPVIDAQLSRSSGKSILGSGARQVTTDKFVVTGVGDADTYSAFYFDDDALTGTETPQNGWGILHKKANGRPQDELQIGYYNAAGTFTRSMTVTRGSVAIGNGNALPGTYALCVYGTARKTSPGVFWSTPSDRRLKHDIEPLGGSLEKLTKLRPVTYKWNEPEKNNGETGTLMGFIAQDVEEVFPDWVDTDAEGYKHLTLKGIIPLEIESIKELDAQREALVRKNQVLTARLDALERQIGLLERL